MRSPAAGRPAVRRVDAGKAMKTIGLFLEAAVRARFNIVIGGPMNGGKTTLMMALCNAIGPDERLVTIEDNRELDLHLLPHRHPDVVSMETREPSLEGEGAISASDLVRMALRMHASRVILGEVRGPEVIPMLNAMNQGSDGSLCTIHASSAAGVFDRIATYCVQAPERLNRESAMMLIGGAVDLIVYVDLTVDATGVERRRVTEILTVGESKGLEMVWDPILKAGEILNVKDDPDDTNFQFSTDALSPRDKRRLYRAGFDCTLHTGTIR